MKLEKDSANEGMSFYTTKTIQSTTTWDRERTGSPSACACQPRRHCQGIRILNLAILTFNESRYGGSASLHHVAKLWKKIESTRRRPAPGPGENKVPSTMGSALPHPVSTIASLARLCSPGDLRDQKTVLEIDLTKLTWKGF